MTITAADIRVSPRLSITDPEQVVEAARRLADGAVVGHAFGNFYAITTRGDDATVRGVNLMKGRPPDQVGSITGPPAALPEVWDLDRFPDELPRKVILTMIDTFLGLGPFGFRGPAAPHVPSHLSALDADVLTAQVIAPGHRCPSNAFLAAARREVGHDLLYVTSANRSRHLTGADDSPAHWRADGLRAEFGDHPDFMIIEHADEVAARANHPEHLPMSTTVLGLHRIVHVHGDARPHLVLERHGSLPATRVREIVATFGFGLVLGPRAQSRLLPRSYAGRSTDDGHT